MDRTSPVVLVVDDDAAIRTLVVEALHRGPVPCSAEQAASLAAVEARLEAAAEGRAPWPALVLLDLHLGSDSGLDVLDLVTRRAGSERFVPVVVVTGSCHPVERVACYRRGAVGYLLKPMGFKRLRAALDPVLAYWLGVMGA